MQERQPEESVKPVDQDTVSSLPGDIRVLVGNEKVGDKLVRSFDRPLLLPASTYVCTYMYVPSFSPTSNYRSRFLVNQAYLRNSVFPVTVLAENVAFPRCPRCGKTFYHHFFTNENILLPIR